MYRGGSGGDEHSSSSNNTNNNSDNNTSAEASRENSRERGGGTVMPSGSFRDVTSRTPRVDTERNARGRPGWIESYEDYKRFLSSLPLADRRAQHENDVKDKMHRNARKINFNSWNQNWEEKQKYQSACLKEGGTPDRQTDTSRPASGTSSRGRDAETEQALRNATGNLLLNMVRPRVQDEMEENLTRMGATETMVNTPGYQPNTRNTRISDYTSRAPTAPKLDKPKETKPKEVFSPKGDGKSSSDSKSVSTSSEYRAPTQADMKARDKTDATQDLAEKTRKLKERVERKKQEIVKANDDMRQVDARYQQDMKNIHEKAEREEEQLRQTQQEDRRKKREDVTERWRRMARRHLDQMDGVLIDYNREVQKITETDAKKKKRLVIKARRRVIQRLIRAGMSEEDILAARVPEEWVEDYETNQDEEEMEEDQKRGAETRAQMRREGRGQVSKEEKDGSERPIVGEEVYINEDGVYQGFCKQELEEEETIDTENRRTRENHRRADKEEMEALKEVHRKQEKDLKEHRKKQDEQVKNVTKINNDTEKEVKELEKQIADNERELQAQATVTRAQAPAAPVTPVTQQRGNTPVTQQRGNPPVAQYRDSTAPRAPAATATIQESGYNTEEEEERREQEDRLKREKKKRDQKAREKKEEEDRVAKEMEDKFSRAEREEQQFRGRLEDMAPTEQDAASKSLGAFKTRMKRLWRDRQDDMRKGFRATFRSELPRLRADFEEVSEYIDLDGITKYRDGTLLVSRNPPGDDRTEFRPGAVSRIRRKEFRKHIASRDEYDRAEREAYDEIMEEENAAALPELDPDSSGSNTRPRDSGGNSSSSSSAKPSGSSNSGSGQSKDDTRKEESSRKSGTELSSSQRNTQTNERSYFSSRGGVTTPGSETSSGGLATSRTPSGSYNRKETEEERAARKKKEKEKPPAGGREPEYNPHKHKRDDEDDDQDIDDNLSRKFTQSVGSSQMRAGNSSSNSGGGGQGGGTSSSSSSNQRRDSGSNKRPRNGDRYALQENPDNESEDDHNNMAVEYMDEEELEALENKKRKALDKAKKDEEKDWGKQIRAYEALRIKEKVFDGMTESERREWFEQHGTPRRAAKIVITEDYMKSFGFTKEERMTVRRQNRAEIEKYYSDNTRLYPRRWVMCEMDLPLLRYGVYGGHEQFQTLGEFEFGENEYIQDPRVQDGATGLGGETQSERIERLAVWEEKKEAALEHLKQEAELDIEFENEQYEELWKRHNMDNKCRVVKETFRRYRAPRKYVCIAALRDLDAIHYGFTIQERIQLRYDNSVAEWVERQKEFDGDARMYFSDIEEYERKTDAEFNEYDREYQERKAAAMKEAIRIEEKDHHNEMTLYEKRREMKRVDQWDPIKQLKYEQEFKPRRTTCTKISDEVALKHDFQKEQIARLHEEQQLDDEIYDYKVDHNVTLEEAEYQVKKQNAIKIDQVCEAERMEKEWARFEDQCRLKEVDKWPESQRRRHYRLWRPHSSCAPTKTRAITQLETLDYNNAEFTRQERDRIKRENRVELEDAFGNDCLIRPKSGTPFEFQDSYLDWRTRQYLWDEEKSGDSDSDIQRRGGNGDKTRKDKRAQQVPSKVQELEKRDQQAKKAKELEDQQKKKELEESIEYSRRLRAQSEMRRQQKQDVKRQFRNQPYGFLYQEESESEESQVTSNRESPTWRRPPAEEEKEKHVNKPDKSVKNVNKKMTEREELEKQAAEAEQNRISLEKRLAALVQKQVEEAPEPAPEPEPEPTPKVATPKEKATETPKARPGEDQDIQYDEQEKTYHIGENFRQVPIIRQFLKDGVMDEKGIKNLANLQVPNFENETEWKEGDTVLKN
eukprot:gene29030-36009_t